MSEPNTEFIPYEVPQGTVLDPQGVPGYRVQLFATGEVQAFPAVSGAPSEANAASDIAAALNADPVPGRRAELKGRLAYRRWQYEVSGGVTVAAFPGYTFHSDDRSQFNVISTLSAINLGIFPASVLDGGWKTEQGVFVSIDVAGLSAVAQACGQRKATAYGYEEYLIAQLDAADTTEELETLSLAVEEFAP